MTLRPLILLLSLVTFASCPPDLDNTPAFLSVEGFALRVTDGQGAATTAISEVWVFVDDEFAGVFPLPARIPVFRQGPTAIRLEAGIRQDGRSVTPDIYPFYRAVELRPSLLPGETISVGVPEIAYRGDAVFGFVEGFEPGQPRVFTDVLTPTDGILPQTEVVKSGTAAGAIVLTDTSRVVEVASAMSFGGLNRLPISVWLEVDYLSEAPAIFGVIGQVAGVTVREFDPGFLPRAEWTKIYFNLSTVVGRANLAELRVAISTRLAEELPRGTVYLDNLKLLYSPS